MQRRTANTASSTRSVRLDELPIAELEALLLDDWVPTKLPVTSVTRGFGYTSITERTSFGGDWTPLASFTLQLLGSRPVQLLGYAMEVTVPAGSDAQFAFGWDSTEPHSESSYCISLLSQTGPAQLADLITDEDLLRAGEHTVYLLGRSSGSVAGLTRVASAAGSFAGKVWGYEF